MNVQKKDSTYVVYMHTNKKTGKRYIGYTADYERRCKDHQFVSSGCRLFSNSIKKHGWDVFEHKIIAETKDVDMAIFLEEIFIRGFNTMAPNGYNLRASGDAKVFSEETKRLMSLAKKGKVGPRLGWIPPDKTRRIWSEQRMGRVPYNKGMPMSIEAIEKMKKTKMDRGVNKPNSGSFYKGITAWNKGIIGMPSAKQGKEYAGPVSINGITFKLVSEACLYFGKSRRTIYRWLNGKNECFSKNAHNKLQLIGESKCE